MRTPAPMPPRPPPAAGPPRSSSLRPLLAPSASSRATRRSAESAKVLSCERSTPWGGSSASDTTSFPPYEVVSKAMDYDLRLYSPHFAVECDYSRRDEGFEKVASYASGANEAGARFAESQPVVMHFPPGTAAKASDSSAGESQEPKVMSLHIGPRLSKKSSSSESPSSSSSETTPPLPTRDGVRLAARGGELVAAARVPAQYATPEAALSAVAALAAALQRDGLRLCERDARGAFRLAQYGALFQLEERVNEVQLRVEL